MNCPKNSQSSTVSSALNLILIIMTGLIYVLFTDRRSKLRISLSIRVASEIIILLTMSVLPVMPASVAGQ